jgi:YHS domain-containing protein
MKSIFSILALSIFLAGLASAAPPVNEECPVCGKNGRLIFRSYYNGPNPKFKGKNIIFNSADCKEKFDKDPEKYLSKVKLKDDK